MAEATGDEFRASAWLLGDILEDIRDSISFNEPQFTDGYIDLEWYGVQKYGYGQIEVDLTFNESIVECGDDTGDRIVVCADTVLPMTAGEVLVAAIIVDEPIPLRSADRSLIYSAVFDSDGDPANDWRYVEPFDWDYFQGADRWYQLIYDHGAGEWFVTVTQLTADGSIPPATEPSSVRVVVEGDTVVFFVSMEEFVSATPGYRLSAFGHDGFFSETDRGGDVSGDRPDEPLPVVSDAALPAAPTG
jgi:hypothetical protein